MFLPANEMLLPVIAKPSGLWDRAGHSPLVQIDLGMLFSGNSGGRRLWFSLCLDKKRAEGVIQGARVDQALCDKLEAGQAHGECALMGGYVTFGCDGYRLDLNRCAEMGACCLQHGVLSPFYHGAPYIETSGGMALVWPEPFPHVMMTCYSAVFSSPKDIFGISAAEHAQIAALGSMWGLSGKWGERNRLPGNFRWHDDDSLLTTIGDDRALVFLVCGTDGQPQYALEIFPVDCGNMLLPFRLLKHKGYPGPRRGFLPPEENIAIWFDRPLDDRIKRLVLTTNPGPILYGCMAGGDAALGCFPGGASMVAKADLAALWGRECMIVIEDLDDKEEVVFAVALVTRMRKNFHTPSVVCFDEVSGRLCELDLGGRGLVCGRLLTEFEIREILLPELGGLAAKMDVFVPEELRCDYCGDLTEKIAEIALKPIIEGILCAGECLAIHTFNFAPQLLAAHIASRLQNGENIFTDLWSVSECKKTMTLADRGSEMSLKRFRTAPGVRLADCRFCTAKPEERLRQFGELVRSSDVVLISAAGLMEEQPELCAEVIRYCVSHGKAVILFPGAPLASKLKRLVSRSFTTTPFGAKDGLGLRVDDAFGTDSVFAVFKADGSLLRAERSLETGAALLAAESPELSRNETVQRFSGFRQ